MVVGAARAVDQRALSEEYRELTKKTEIYRNEHGKYHSHACGA